MSQFCCQFWRVVSTPVISTAVSAGVTAAVDGIGKLAGSDNTSDSWYVKNVAVPLTTSLAVAFFLHRTSQNIKSSKAYVATSTLLGSGANLAIGFAGKTIGALCQVPQNLVDQLDNSYIAAAARGAANGIGSLFGWGAAEVCCPSREDNDGGYQRIDDDDCIGNCAQSCFHLGEAIRHIP